MSDAEGDCEQKMADNNNIGIMVCVTRQRSCERLIKRAVSLNKEMRTTVAVVHVAMNGEDLLGNPNEGDALDILFSVSKYNDAQMHMLRSDTLAETVLEFAREHNVRTLVLGESRTTGQKVKSIVKAFEKNMPEVEIHIVPA